MAKTEMPFANFTNEFTKMFADFKLPTFDKLPAFDADGIMAVQKRNFEVLTQANRLTAESFQTVAKRQAEIFREAIEEFQATYKDVFTAGGAEASAAKQAEYAKAAFEKAVANVKELGEITSKAQAEVLELFNKRAVELMDEVKQTAAKATKK